MKKVFEIVVTVSFLLYALVLLWLLFFNLRGYWSNVSLCEYIKYATNFIPLKTIIRYINALSNGSMNIDIPIKNLAGNLLLFMPLGFYLPFIFKNMTKIKIYSGFVAIIILLIEVLQILTRRGRFDIDDFILNIIGALVGFWICNHTPIRNLLKSHYKQNENRGTP